MATLDKNITKNGPLYKIALENRSKSVNDILDIFAKKYEKRIDSNVEYVVSIRDKPPTFLFLDPVYVLSKCTSIADANTKINLNDAVIVFEDVKQARNRSKKINDSENFGILKLSIFDKYTEKVYDLSSLEITLTCSSCGREINKKRHLVLDCFRSRAIVCRKCMYSISHLTDKYQKKYKSVFNERYGADLPLQVEEFKHNQTQTMLERYGVEYSAQSAVIREKYHRTMMTLYGKKAVTGYFSRNSYSELESRFIDRLLEIMSLELKDFTLFYYANKQFFLAKKDEYCHSIDFYIKELKYALEINGDFWHGNLDVFDKNKMHPYIHKTFKEVNELHKERESTIRNSDKVFFLRSFWENEINANFDRCINIVVDDIRKMISNRKGNNDEV